MSLSVEPLSTLLSMAIRLYNTLGSEIQTFDSIEKNKVSMYHCGPTVYDQVHIGNLRSFVLADLLRRMFEYEGFEVKQVMNITDLGHLVGDGDTGEDKMTKGLIREGLEINKENMKILADKYTEKFKEDISLLNILTPSVFPKASEHIDEQVALIQKLKELGFTYETSDAIYFDITKDPEYGKLVKINFDPEFNRVVSSEEKRNPQDFALWKFDEKLGFETELGKGFPGWHIECSAMSMKYLGNKFDIHTGGIDLASIHHNNEIAQSESATGEKPFAKFWLHNEFVNLGIDKMAKSGGNSITMKDILEKGFSPLAYRYLLLLSNYRTPTNFTWEALEAAENAYKRLKTLMLLLKSKSEKEGKVDSKYKQEFLEALENDLNTPEALAVVWKLSKNAGDDISYEDARATLLDFDKVLGLKLSENEYVVKNIPPEVQILLDEREAAREKKDFNKSDELREKIEKLGYSLKDTENGQEISAL